MIFRAHVERRILSQLVAGLGELPFSAVHCACHDQRLSASPASGQAAAHQKLV
jgi:hypothetical protein